MNHATCQRKAEARIRQLCCLGLGSEAVVPALLRELHALVPSHSNGFYWAGANGRVSNAYNEIPEAQSIAQLYVRDAYNTGKREVTRSLGEAVQREHGVVRDWQTLKVSRRDFYRSDFYNLLLRPLGYGRLLRLVLRGPSGRCGVLQLQRQLRDPDFTDRDVERLSSIEPFLVQALTWREGVRAELLVDSGEYGMLIADGNGRLLAMSPQGRQLLHLACHPRMETGREATLPTHLPPAIAAICMRLLQLHARGDVAQAPVVSHDNVWGRFVFRGHLLDGPADPTGMIGISVHREVPLPIQLVHGTRHFDLSPRQAQTAVLLASGLSHQAIAERLGITRHTVIAHARWIYSKLSIHDSGSLREHLLARGKPADSKDT
ncbi:MAG: helix-turn-helix transcriptional regulator [Xanthomonadaceae bacterium]|nr:helix-turn-helix transcriptional regulator [Xanthomonadaceae bacterium]